jgi:hypothetical protein
MTQKFFYTPHIVTYPYQIREGEDDTPPTETVDENKTPGADYGDELTPAQEEAAAKETEKAAIKKLTDEEVDAALEALDGKPPATKDGESDEKPKPNAKKDTRIPKKRFDEAVRAERERAEAAEAELERLKAASNPPTEGPTPDDQIASAKEDVTKARAAWQKALLNNDEEAADAALSVMLDAENTLDDMRIEFASTAARQGASDDVSFDNALVKLEARYPQIDEAHADYDKELNSTLGTLFTGFVRGGMNRHQALQKAADLILVPLDTKPGKEKGEKEETLRDKAKGALKKTVENQPPDTDQVSHADTPPPTLKPSRMTRKQFEKLSEEQLAVLRGDVAA